MEFFNKLEMIILNKILRIAVSELSGMEKTVQAKCYEDILCHVRNLRDEYKADKLKNLKKKNRPCKINSNS